MAEGGMVVGILKEDKAVFTFGDYKNMATLEEYKDLDILE